jgi:hypothetical protein
MAKMRELHFQFDELVINLDEVVSILGFTRNDLPEPFNSYLQEVLQFSDALKDIRAVFHTVDHVKIDGQKGTILAEEIEFQAGNTVCSELKGSESLAFFICTAGKTISDKCVQLLQGENPVLGYVYDVLGSIIAEAAGDRMLEMLKIDIENEMYKITNRYSPGYCNWNVSDQHKLFSLFHNNTCGVTLTPSALMQPVKSISGVIGIGAQVKFRKYQCTLCSSTQCIYRRVRQS